MKKGSGFTHRCVYHIIPASQNRPSHDDTMRKKGYLQDFKKPPNQNSIDIPMQISKALFVANSNL